METLTALVTAVLWCLFCAHCWRERRKREDQQAGPLLGRFVIARSWAGHMGILSHIALLLVTPVIILWVFWDSWLSPLFIFALVCTTFNLAFQALGPNPIWQRVMEFHEWGIRRYKMGAGLYAVEIHRILPVDKGSRRIADSAARLVSRYAQGHHSSRRHGKGQRDTAKPCQAG